MLEKTKRNAGKTAKESNKTTNLGSTIEGTKNKNDTVKCCICGKEIRMVESNNAAPFAIGRCCNECNSSYVIPLRIHLMRQELNKEKLKGK